MCKHVQNEERCEIERKVKKLDITIAHRKYK